MSRLDEIKAAWFGAHDSDDQWWLVGREDAESLLAEVEGVMADARTAENKYEARSEEVGMLRDVIARLAEVEQWDEYQAVLSELDGYPLFEGWKR